MERQQEHVVCVRNDGYAASLELLKLYRLVPDSEAEACRHVHVIDESDEDYLYPIEFFVMLDLPHSVRVPLDAAA